MIYLKDITSENWRIPLEVAPSQKTYVADKTTLLARAYAYRQAHSYAFLIYHNETPVGMGLYYDCEEMQCYVFSQLFIDKRYQGKGYGLAAVKLVLNSLKQDGRYDKVSICYIEGNTPARRLYEKLGFIETEQDGNEIIMERNLSAPVSC
ncbi:MAG: GNAT family N-acetyltransferase [Lachnospiraceae bacterium]|nr:GNAT family N-acetyltransferase [Lachnospiraceae bacterium]